MPKPFPVATVGIPHITIDEMREVDRDVIEDGHVPVRYPGRHNIRANWLRGENLAAYSDNS